MQSSIVPLRDALLEFAGVLKVRDCGSMATALLVDAAEALPGVVPDATTLQAAWCLHIRDVTGPLELVQLMATVIDKHFPKQQYHEITVPRSGTLELVPPKGLRVRICAGLVLTAYASDLINSDATSHCEQRPVYVPDEWTSEDGSVPTHGPSVMPDLLEEWKAVCSLSEQELVSR
jgi:hypothetical protein